MPDIGENRAVWDGNYEWRKGGDEWSSAWGNSTVQWESTILPRISRFLPAPTILEIAPGFGRWSERLIPLCDDYIGIDLSASAVEACRRRFASSSHASFHVNDGRSLDAVPDGSIDLVFSFDSLVHVEADVIDAYLSALAKKLKPHGVAFIHHSNLGEYYKAAHRRRLLGRLLSPIRGDDALGWMHWRAESMTASRFVDLCSDSGLHCVSQEVINWLGSRLIDCISVVTRPGSTWDGDHRILRNPFFLTEAVSGSAVAHIYGRAGDIEPQVSLHPIPGSRTVVACHAIGAYQIFVVGPWLKRSKR